ncbi:hypothetical protein HYV80_02625 [Candidatus Woesearchaeota archaeon]|nr:hypothetical protein [Candidatus Woesearchaeota archaeon]
MISLLFLVIFKIPTWTNDNIKQNPYLYYDKSTIDLVALSGTEKAFLCDHCKGGYGFFSYPLARAYTCSCNGAVLPTYHDYPSRKIITEEEILDRKENAIDKNDDVMKMLKSTQSHCFKVCGDNFLSSWAYPSIKVLQCYCRGEEKSRFFDADSLNPIKVSENKEIKD